MRCQKEACIIIGFTPVELVELLRVVHCGSVGTGLQELSSYPAHCPLALGWAGVDRMAPAPAVGGGGCARGDPIMIAPARRATTKISTDSDSPTASRQDTTGRECHNMAASFVETCA